MKDREIVLFMSVSIHLSKPVQFLSSMYRATLCIRLVDDHL